MEKVVLFDQNQKMDDFLPRPEANKFATNGQNKIVTLRSKFEKKP